MGIFQSLIHAYLEGAYWGRGQDQTFQKPFDESIAFSDRAMGALQFLNRYIHRHHGREGIFATLFFGILTIPEGRLDYINAGHEPLMIISRKRRMRELRPTGPAVGISSKAIFTLQSDCLEPGETLIGFTDGITDACKSSSGYLHPSCCCFVWCYSSTGH